MVSALPRARRAIRRSLRRRRPLWCRPVTPLRRCITRRLQCQRHRSRQYQLPSTRHSPRHRLLRRRLCTKPPSLLRLLPCSRPTCRPSRLPHRLFPRHRWSLCRHQPRLSLRQSRPRRQRRSPSRCAARHRLPPRFRRSARLRPSLSLHRHRWRSRLPLQLLRLLPQSRHASRSLPHRPHHRWRPHLCPRLLRRSLSLSPLQLRASPPRAAQSRCGCRRSPASRA